VGRTLTPVIFSIDPSLESTGICVLNEYGNPILFQAILHSLGDPERLKYIYDTLTTLLRSYSPEIIVYERQVEAMRYNYAAGSMIPLAELAGVMKLAISEYPLWRSVWRFPADEIKLRVTGNRRALKESMMEAVSSTVMTKMKSYVVNNSLNDVTDAYHLARVLREILVNGETPEILSKYLYQKRGTESHETV
jgi:Holliday junction resolvasome RuvABC endonuclease subunit